MAYSLTPFSEILGLRKAKHLLRRATYNYSKETLNNVANMTATEAVSFLSENSTEVLAAPFEDVTNEYLINSTETQRRAYVTAWWWYNAVKQTNLKHKLSYFLFTSFTVSNGNGAGEAIYFYDYLRLLNFYAMGNIKTLAKKITLDNAMLRYLDNTENNATNPNENYAREFLELFTILKGPQISEENYTNYTELDIQQAAKVFTGFKKKSDRSIIDPDTDIPIGYNNVNKHDTSDKVFSSAFNNHIISGQSTQAGMTQELNDFVEMVFAQEATARAYCRKLYRFFVKSEWNESVESEIIAPLAQELISNNFELLPTVTTLLCSEHFFDEDTNDNSDEIIGSIVKSPLQLLTEVLTFFDIPIPDPETVPIDYYNDFFRKFIHNSYLVSAGMPFFSPDSVAGYPAHYQEPDFDRHWFSSSTILARYRLIECLITGRNKLGGNGQFGSELDTVVFVENTSANPGNIYYLIDEIANILYPNPIDEDRVNYFAELILEDYPSYYWTDTWDEYLATGENTTVKNRLDLLIGAMINAPEYQLM